MWAVFEAHTRGLGIQNWLQGSNNGDQSLSTIIGLKMSGHKLWGKPGPRCGILATAKKLENIQIIPVKMASSKTEKRRKIIRRRREMIRKRTRTIFNKCYELCTKTSLQVAVVTYDEIQNSYRVFRTSPMFMAAIMREIASFYPYHKWQLILTATQKCECSLVEDLVAGLTIFANNEGTYQGEESSAESNEEGDLREELEDVALEHDLLQNQEQESPPAESEVTQEQHVGHNMELMNHMVTNKLGSSSHGR
jgi:hypothetical protein